ncbi:hypothetical protein pb186bvf_010560 [Paramecium bursaria]
MGQQHDSGIQAEIETKFSFQKQINDARYGEGRLYNNSSGQVLFKEISAPDDTVYKSWQEKLRQHSTLKHPNIIELKRFETQTSDQMCSTFYRIYMLFEYIPQTLKDQIETQQRQGTFFKREQIEQMLQQSISALAKFQEQRVSHQNLRPSTISFSNQIKISDLPLLTSVTQFSALIQDYTGKLSGYYLSPILTKAVGDGQTQVQHNLYKSDVFTLGVIFLHVSLLKNMDKLYTYEEGRIDVQQLRTFLEQLSQVYGGDIHDIIQWMLEIQEKDRPDFIELRKQYCGESNQLVEQFYEAQQFMIQQPLHQQDLQAQPDESFNQPISIKKDNHIDDSHNQLKQSKKDGPIRKIYYDSLELSQGQAGQTLNQQNMYIQQEIQLEKDGIPPPQFRSDQIDQVKKPQELRPTQYNKPDFLINNNQILNNSNSPIKGKQSQIKNININAFPINGDESFLRRYDQFTVSTSQTHQIQPISFANNQQFQSALPVQASQTIKQSQIELNNRFAQSPVSPIYQQPIYQQPLKQSNTQYQNGNGANYMYQQIQLKYSHESSQLQQLKQSNMNQVNHLNNYNNDYKPVQLIKQVQSINSHKQQIDYVTENLADGMKYVGEKINGIRDGRGRLYYREGGYYDGEWSNNQMTGKGTLYYANGRPAYDGDWVNEKFEGKGTLYNDNPRYLDIDFRNLNSVGEGWTKYVGQFHDDCKHGQGVLHFLNGDIFEGVFQNDQANGNGKYIRLGGQIIQGQWYDNVLRS